MGVGVSFILCLHNLPCFLWTNASNCFDEALHVNECQFWAKDWNVEFSIKETEVTIIMGKEMSAKIIKENQQLIEDGNFKYQYLP